MARAAGWWINSLGIRSPASSSLAEAGSQGPLGFGGTRQARRRASGSLLPQRRNANLRTDRLRQDRAGGLEPGRPQQLPPSDRAVGRALREENPMTSRMATSKVAVSIRPGLEEALAHPEAP